MGVLPGYECQSDQDGVEHSKGKLKEAANDLQQPMDNKLSITMVPCQSKEETYGYRCVCTFQLLKKDEKFHYAMRHNKEPLILETNNSFPIATTRIQRAMEALLGSLNDEESLSMHVTSVSFASSWSEASPDCIVTLMYGQPIADQQLWKTSAKSVCHTLQLTKLIGRSKGRIVSVSRMEEHDYLEDTVYLYQTEGNVSRATLSRDKVRGDNCVVEVYYQKPETAFFHPNSRAMINALEWMLRRLKQCTEKRSTMLEMYCGCGAHTVAIAKSGLVKSIVAVELDKRLVDACITNCKINGCYEKENEEGRTPVHVVQGDASEWAKKSMKSKGGWYNKDYSVLLVDPPRMGLDEHVCRMACQGPFQDLLYISCGRHALKRDLEALKDVFEVVDCHLLDLFPRTDAVESLIHLKRRQPSSA